MIDFHTHILFNIDDGSKSIEESVKMLEEAYQSGTDLVVLTSHFYPFDEQSLDDFLLKRASRIEELKKACIGRAVPQMRLGAEVNVHTPFSSFKRIKELCIEGTDYMLIEMPYTRWDDWVMECVFNLTLRGIKPIIAHIDRYIQYPSSVLSALAEISPVYQVSSDAFLSHNGRKVVLDLFKKGWIHVIGSDMHGTVKRKNTMPDAYVKLENTFGEAYKRFIEDNGFRIIDNKSVVRCTHFPKTKKIKLFF